MIHNLFLVCIVSLSGQCAHGYVYKVDDSNELGRRFDGVGALSAGASSKLLVNYPQKQRDEILDYLFKPDFGAALHLLKVEIGGDMQSTDGSEASHMRLPNEENYERGYEWWLMQEAKKRNPDLQLIGLPWGWPGWLGGDSGDVYDNPQQTALYIVKWILGAKDKYGLHIDYIGIWNESRYTTKYIKVLRQVLDAHALQSTLIVAADNIRDWEEISAQVLEDPDLADSIYAIGVHYPYTNSSLLAMDTGKQLWASEDHATNTYSLWNLNYVNGYMSGTVMWPVLSAFYKGLEYQGVGLMNASEPWSGHYDTALLVYIVAHTTQFTRPGWTFLRHGSGVGRFANGGIYVSLVSPDRKDFTIIIETTNPNDNGIKYKPENISLKLEGSLTSITELNCWFSQIQHDDFKNSLLFEKQQPIKVINDVVNLELEPYQIYTLTTLTAGGKGSYSAPPPSKPFPLPYQDNFDDYREREEPYNISPQTGAYEATTFEGHGKVMRQMTWQRPVAWSTWCPMESAGVTLALIGEYYWEDVYIESEVYINLNLTERATGVYLAARVEQGGCHADNNTGVYFYFYPQSKTYIVSSDLKRNTIYTSGSIKSASYGWNNMALSVKGSTGIGYLNAMEIFTINTIPTNVKSGFAGLGTASYGAACFDNLQITP